MGRFGGDQVLPVYKEEDEDLFETSSSVSGDSDGEAPELSQFGLQVAPKTVRRMNSDSVYDMASLKSELPAKKGLSRYYDGKSQSFHCMSEVRCLEDLRKKKRPCKEIRSYVVDLDDGSQEEACPAPQGPNRSSCANLMARNGSAAANMLYRPLPIPVNKGAYRQ